MAATGPAADEVDPQGGAMPSEGDVDAQGGPDQRDIGGADASRGVSEAAAPTRAVSPSDGPAPAATADGEQSAEGPVVNDDVDIAEGAGESSRALDAAAGAAAASSAFEPDHDGASTPGRATPAEEGTAGNGDASAKDSQDTAGAVGVEESGEVVVRTSPISVGAVEPSVVADVAGSATGEAIAGLGPSEGGGGGGGVAAPAVVRAPPALRLNLTTMEDFTASPTKAPTSARVSPVKGGSSNRSLAEKAAEKAADSAVGRACLGIPRRVRYACCIMLIWTSGVLMLSVAANFTYRGSVTESFVGVVDESALRASETISREAELAEVAAGLLRDAWHLAGGETPSSSLMQDVLRAFPAVRAVRGFADDDLLEVGRMAMDSSELYEAVLDDPDCLVISSVEGNEELQRQCGFALESQPWHTVLSDDSSGFDEESSEYPVYDVQPSWTPPYNSFIDGELVVSVTFRLRRESEDLGAVAADFRVEDANALLQSEFAEVAGHTGSSVFIFDTATGMVLSSSQPGDTDPQHKSTYSLGDAELSAPTMRAGETIASAFPGELSELPRTWVSTSLFGSLVAVHSFQGGRWATWRLAISFSADTFLEDRSEAWAQSLMFLAVVLVGFGGGGGLYFISKRRKDDRTTGGRNTKNQPRATPVKFAAAGAHEELAGSDGNLRRLSVLGDAEVMHAQILARTASADHGGIAADTGSAHVAARHLDASRALGQRSRWLPVGLFTVTIFMLVSVYGLWSVGQGAVIDMATSRLRALETHARAKATADAFVNTPITLSTIIEDSLARGDMSLAVENGSEGETVSLHRLEAVVADLVRVFSQTSTPVMSVHIGLDDSDRLFGADLDGSRVLLTVGGGDGLITRYDVLTQEEREALLRGEPLELRANLTSDVMPVHFDGASSLDWYAAGRAAGGARVWTNVTVHRSVVGGDRLRTMLVQHVSDSDGHSGVVGIELHAQALAESWTSLDEESTYNRTAVVVYEDAPARAVSVGLSRDEVAALGIGSPTPLIVASSRFPAVQTLSNGFPGRVRIDFDQPLQRSLGLDPQWWVNTTQMEAVDVGGETLWVNRTGRGTGRAWAMFGTVGDDVERGWTLALVLPETPFKGVVWEWDTVLFVVGSTLIILSALSVTFFARLISARKKMTLLRRSATAIASFVNKSRLLAAPFSARLSRPETRKSEISMAEVDEVVDGVEVASDDNDSELELEFQRQGGVTCCGQRISVDIVQPKVPVDEMPLRELVRKHCFESGLRTALRGIRYDLLEVLLRKRGARKVLSKYGADGLQGYWRDVGNDAALWPAVARVTDSEDALERSEEALRSGDTEDGMYNHVKERINIIAQFIHKSLKGDNVMLELFISRFTEKRQAALRFHSSWGWSIFAIFACLLHLVLSFTEAGPDKVRTNNRTGVLVAEALLLLVHFVDTGLYWYSYSYQRYEYGAGWICDYIRPGIPQQYLNINGHTVNIARMRRVAGFRFVCILVIFVDFVFRAATDYRTGPVEFAFLLPYSAVLRPMLLVTRSSTVRSSAKNFAATILKSSSVFILAISFLMFAGATGVSLLEGRLGTAGLGRGFDTFREALVTMFVFVTTGENYTEVIYPAAETHPWFKGYFIAFSFVGLFLLISVLTASFQEYYGRELDKSDKAHEIRTRLWRRAGLLTAFHLLLSLPALEDYDFGSSEAGNPSDTSGDAAQVAGGPSAAPDSAASESKDEGGGAGVASAAAKSAAAAAPPAPPALPSPARTGWSGKLLREGVSSNRRSRGAEAFAWSVNRMGGHAASSTLSDMLLDRLLGIARARYSRDSISSRTTFRCAADEFAEVLQRSQRSGCDSSFLDRLDRFASICKGLTDTSQVVPNCRSLQNYIQSIEFAARDIDKVMRRRVHVSVASDTHSFYYPAHGEGARAKSDNRYLDAIMTYVVVMNLFTVAFLTARLDEWVPLATGVFLVVYTGEMTRRISVEGGILEFWRSASREDQRYTRESYQRKANRYDLLIVCVAVLAFFAVLTYSDATKPHATACTDTEGVVTECEVRAWSRAVACIPLLRLFSIVRVTRPLVFGLIGTLPDLYPLFGLLAVAVYLYALVGCWNLAGTLTSLSVEVYEVQGANFDSFSAALSTMFHLMTGEGWHEVMYGAIDATDSLAPCIFFMSFIVLVVLLFTQMFIGIVCDNFSKLQEQARTFERDQERREVNRRVQTTATAVFVMRKFQRTLVERIRKRHWRTRLQERDPHSTDELISLRVKEVEQLHRRVRATPRSRRVRDDILINAVLSYTHPEHRYLNARREMLDAIAQSAR